VGYVAEGRLREHHIYIYIEYTSYMLIIFSSILLGKEGRSGAWWREPALRKQLDTEPEPDVRRYTDASIFRGFCFLGSGGWAFKQHVVLCVNPIL